MSLGRLVGKFMHVRRGSVAVALVSIKVSKMF